MKVIARFQDTESLELTITMTQTLAGWKRLNEIIEVSPDHARPYPLLRAIRDAANKAGESIVAEMEND